MGNENKKAEEVKKNTYDCCICCGSRKDLIKLYGIEGVYICEDCEKQTRSMCDLMCES